MAALFLSRHSELLVFGVSFSDVMERCGFHDVSFSLPETNTMIFMTRKDSLDSQFDRGSLTS